MSTHYLVDMHTSPVTNSEINDVRFAANGQTVLGGNFVVRLQDGVSIGNTPPTSLTDLLTKKYAGLLAFYPGYTRITFDDFLDASGIDITTSTGISAGGRCTTSLAGDGSSVFVSLPTALTGPTPTQAIITFETHDVTSDSPRDDRTQRTYQETVPGAVGTCEVSFNGGVSFLPTTDAGLLNIPLPDQGISFVFRFTAGAVFPARVFLGSWAVIY